MDRWAGSDGAYDRWAQNDRHDDRWREAEPPHDRWREAEPEYDHWREAEPQYDHWREAEPQYDHWREAEPQYDHMARTDGEFDRHDTPTGLLRSSKVKWVGLLAGWVVVTGILLAVHLTILIWVVMVGLIVYVVYSILRETPPAPHRPRRHDTVSETADDDRERFNAPPGWPEPPPGWTPPPGWRPNPAWPPAPPGWQFWLPAARRGYDARAGRARHHRGEPDDYRLPDGWR